MKMHISGEKKKNPSSALFLVPHHASIRNMSINKFVHISCTDPNAGISLETWKNKTRNIIGFE